MAASTFLSDGTPLYTYGPGVALAAGENTVARGATAVLRAAPAGALVPMYDLQLRPVDSVRTSDDLGVHPPFFATQASGVLDAGSVQLPLYSVESVAAGLAAESRAASLASLVQQLIDSLGGYVTDAELTTAVQQALAAAGGGGGDFTGYVSTGQISDATDLGRRLVAIVDDAAARDAIGAGTSSLGLGTTAATAKAGDWKPAAADISDATTASRQVLRASTFDAIRALVDPNGGVVVEYGTTAATPRPAERPNGAVYWVGSGTVLPQNAMPADQIWLP